MSYSVCAGASKECMGKVCCQEENKGSCCGSKKCTDTEKKTCSEGKSCCSNTCDCGDKCECSKKTSSGDKCCCGDKCDCGDKCECPKKTSSGDKCCCGDKCDCVDGRSCGDSKCPVSTACCCRRCSCHTGCSSATSRCCVNASMVRATRCPYLQAHSTMAFVGKPAPFFSGSAVMPGGEFKDISLADYRGKYLVLFFYPMDFTFVCPTEIISFNDRVKEFNDIGCEVVAASCDSHYSHLAWTKVPRKQGGIGSLIFPLLSDKNGLIARKYRIYIEDKGISHRGLFIVDKEGVLRQIVVNDLPVGRSVDETLRLVKAYQFTDEHGEVCPSNWKPGSKALDPAKSGEFFTTTYKD